MSNQSRIQAGVPTGGQFAASTHAESDVTLTDPSAAVSATAQTRDAAEEAVRRFEGFLRSGIPQMGEDDLVTAARDLVEHLPEVRARHLESVLARFNDAIEASPDGKPGTGQMNTLHAEMVEALWDGPSNGDIIAARVALIQAQERVRAAVVIRDIGQGSDETVELARGEEAGARSAYDRAEKERYDDAVMRVAQGRPTINDMHLLQHASNVANTARRKAVLAADAARDAYEWVDPSDHDEVHRRARVVDEKTREEAAAEETYRVARKHLADGDAAWRAIHDPEPDTYPGEGEH